MNGIRRLLLCVVASALPLHGAEAAVFGGTCHSATKPDPVLGGGICDPAFINLVRLKEPRFTVEPDRVVFWVYVSSYRTHGTVVAHYGYEPDKLNHSTEPLRYKAPVDQIFPVQIDSLIPGRTIFIRWKHLDDKDASEETEVLNFDLPAYAYKKTDPCPPYINGDGWGEVWPGIIRRPAGVTVAVTPGHGTATRVDESHALVCSGTVVAPGSLSGIHADTYGQLYCPKDFPRNLSATSTTITLPKVGSITFDGNIQYWRESEHLRFNLFIPGLNASDAGQLKPQVREGWHKWNAANWSPHEVKAKYWIWCSNSPDPD